MSARSTRAVVAFALVAAVAVMGADRLVDPIEEIEPAPESTDVEPVAGSWVCPVGDEREGTELRASWARPPGTGEQPAQVELRGLGVDEPVTFGSPPLFPESSISRRTDVGATGALAATWRDGPMVLQREWTLAGGDEEDDLPAGILAGGCTQALSDNWVIPGMVTSGGSQATLRFANPFPADATIAVGFVAPDGPVQPLALRNLSVSGHGTLEIDVNEFAPERSDLAAVVTVASGRVAVEGYQLVRSAIGGIDGVSPLVAAPEASETWTVPWIADVADVASWLWVYNPGERVAPVELSYHTDNGGIVPDGLTEVLVEPGQLRRVDLRGTFPEDVEVVAVTARSDGAPVVVSGAVQFGGDDVDRTGFAVQLGAPESDRSWTISGGSTEGRTEQLHLVNPGSEDAVTSIGVFSGRTIDRPDDLQDITVPAGARRVVDLTEVEGDLSEWTAFITTTGGELVVSRVGSANEGVRSLVAVPGTPSSAWRTQSSGLVLTQSNGMVQRLRTSLGIAAGEAVAPPPGLLPEPEAPIEELPTDPLPEEEPLPEEPIEDAPVDGEVPDEEAPEDEAPADEDAEAPADEEAEAPAEEDGEAAPDEDAEAPDDDEEADEAPDDDEEADDEEADDDGDEPPAVLPGG